MVEEEKSKSSRAPPPLPGGRKTYWRSASWSLRSTLNTGTYNHEQDCSASSNTERANNESLLFSTPLTPRSQNKARSSLPPLQPLSISRRSLNEWPNPGSDDVGDWSHPPTPSGDPKKLPEGMKLDLSSCQKISDSMGNVVKKDRISCFDKECSKVAEHIYLGGNSVAKNWDILKQNSITHVLNCVGSICPEYFKSDLVYKTLWLQDSPSEDITSILYDVFDYFEDVREQGGRVLVHCFQGVSRSTSLVIAYLIWREGQSFEEAFQYVKAARGITNPNMGFACQLLQCQKRVHAIPLSPSSILRMYRMAPHSSYDPLHLVPKTLTDPSPFALDSRGAFIVHVPTAIYVWIGKNCKRIMETDAKGAACQVVRYEKVQGQVIIVEEGEESDDFWDAFRIGSSSSAAKICKEDIQSMSKCVIGKRKVDLYDADFELFHKALSGGVVPPFSTSRAGHETLVPARENNWSTLRRKFIPESMKEWASPSPSRPTLCRVYSDSRLLVDKGSIHSSKFFSSVADNFMSSSTQTNCARFTGSLPPLPQPSSSSSSDLERSDQGSNCMEADSSASKVLNRSLIQRRGTFPSTLKLPTKSRDISLLPRERTVENLVVSHSDLPDITEEDINFEVDLSCSINCKQESRLKNGEDASCKHQLEKISLNNEAAISSSPNKLSLAKACEFHSLKEEQDLSSSVNIASTCS